MKRQLNSQCNIRLMNIPHDIMCRIFAVLNKLRRNNKENAFYVFQCLKTTNRYFKTIVEEFLLDCNLENYTEQELAILCCESCETNYYKSQKFWKVPGDENDHYLKDFFKKNRNHLIRHGEKMLKKCSGIYISCDRFMCSEHRVRKSFLSENLTLHQKYLSLQNPSSIQQPQTLPPSQETRRQQQLEPQQDDSTTLNLVEFDICETCVENHLSCDSCGVIQENLYYCNQCNMDQCLDCFNCDARDLITTPYNTDEDEEGFKNDEDIVTPSRNSMSRITFYNYYDKDYPKGSLEIGNEILTFCSHDCLTKFVLTNKTY